MPRTSRTIKPRRIFFLSSARSDYDLFAPILFSLQKYPRVKPAVIACAAQLSPFHGYGIRQIEADGFPIVGRIESLLSSETWKARALSFANLVSGLTLLLERERPDILVVAGDREEHLAGAIAANFLQIHVAHLYGGDRCLASDIDEVIRPAISKFSHFHFTSTEGHRTRLIKMGERPECIWATGASSLDRLSTPGSTRTVLKKFGLKPTEPFFLVIQHPSPSVSKGNERREMVELLEGVLSTGCRVLCSYPNADPGNVDIREAIDAAKSKYPHLTVYHNLPREEFVALYQNCSGIIGNSSSLIIESTFLKKPAILVGPRQDLRERAVNVLRVDFQRKEIAGACKKALSNTRFLQSVKKVKSLYGDGKSAPRVAKILSSCKLDRSLILKTMPY